MEHRLARSHALLSNLPEAEWLVVHPLLRLVELRAGQPLLQGVFFPTSVTLAVFDRSLMEVSAIYCGEGVMADSNLGLGPLDAQLTVRHTGYAWTISSHGLAERADELKTLMTLLNATNETCNRRAIATLRCGVIHSLEQRVSRYLLEQGEAELEMTQQAIANSIGVRRECVSRVFTMFDRRSVITHRRGHVTVNLTGLRPYSCGCVEFTRNPYASV